MAANLLPSHCLPLLPFTAEEEAGFSAWRATLTSSPGAAVPVPNAVRQALARVMAPMDAQLYEQLKSLRQREHRG